MKSQSGAQGSEPSHPFPSAPAKKRPTSTSVTQQEEQEEKLAGVCVTIKILMMSWSYILPFQ